VRNILISFAASQCCTSKLLAHAKNVLRITGSMQRLKSRGRMLASAKGQDAKATLRRFLYGKAFILRPRSLVHKLH